MEKEQYLETKRKNFNLYFSVGKKGDATKGAGRVSGEMAEGAAVGETPSTADLIWTLLVSGDAVGYLVPDIVIFSWTLTAGNLLPISPSSTAAKTD